MDNKGISEFLINDYNLDLFETVTPSGANFSMCVAPRFVQSYTHGYEKFSTRLVRNSVKEKELFVDVGANYGYYSLLTAKANKDIRIIAVEPIEENFEVLNKNFIHNNIGTKRVKCINAAVSSSSGKIKFYKSEASDNSGVLPHPNSGTLEQLEVNSVSLDDLLKNEQYKSLFIKTDTEGHEMEVLKGLSATFKKCDDITILLEMNPKLFRLAGTSCKEVIEYLASNGFSIYGIDDRESKYYPLDVADNLYKLETEYPDFNALCVKNEKSLSVAFFSHSSALAGVERSLADLVEDLCNDSVLCSVLLPSDGPLKDVLLDKGAAVFVLPEYTHWWAGDKDSFSKDTQKLQLAQGMMATVTGAMPVLRQLKPDVIFTQTIVAPWGALCAEMLSIPHVLSVCEYGELDHHLKFYFGFQESIKALYDSSKAIFSVTKSVKNEVFKEVGDKEDKIEVVYLDVRLAPHNDLNVTPQNYDYKNKSEIKIAIFGTINEGKGQEDIVRAGIELMKRGRKVKIYIIGYSDPHYLAFIKDLIDVSMYKENFIIKDFVNDPIKHMTEMDIAVSCSRNEAFGRTLFESILLDKPIVYSDSGGPKEIFTDEVHGLAYKCADEYSLVEKLLFLMDNPDKTRQRVKAAKEYVVKNFNRENYSGKIEARLKQIKGAKIKPSHSMQALFSVDFLVDALKGEFERKEAEIAATRNVLAERDGQVAGLNHAVTAFETSNSWRVTRPLRWLRHQFKRAKRIVALLPSALRRGGGLKSTLKKAIQLYRREGLAGIKRGFRIVATTPTPGSGEFDRNDYAEWIRRYDTLSDESRATMRDRIDNFVRKPLISVVMPTYNPKPEWLIEAIESIRKQSYPCWELCIADDASTDKRIRPILERYAREDTRIKVVFREKNGHISAASNSALLLATGEWVALLDHDDLLAEHALFWVADAINQNPDACLIYSDEDKIDNSGRRYDHYFKCDWNVDLFYSHNMFSHLGVFHADLLYKSGGFREGLEGSQDYDLVLRCIERIEPKQIYHIPRVLYHWRIHAASTAQSADAKPYAVLAGERALNEHFQRQKINARAAFVGYVYRARYTLPDNLPMVSLIIPTRNGLQLIRQCVESILKKTTYPNYEILIIDNGSDDPATLQYFDELQAEARIRIVRDDRPFNYSALNNAAVKLAQGEVLGLLNNDLEVISPEWLSEMVSHALRPEVGAVGARLWYPDETLQHGGVVLGLGGVAGHAHKHQSRYQSGYEGRAILIQSFSAVTAACLVIRKSLYEEVGGLNEVELQVAFYDIDFCLRVGKSGYRNIWTPYAELYHHDSATRGCEDRPEKQARFAREVQFMKKRWGDTLLNDRAYSPNLTLDHEDFSLAWPPRVDLLAPPRAQVVQQTQLSRVDKALLLVDRKGLGLEIGPSHSPLTPKKAGFNVRILDHATRLELIEKYRGHDVNLDNIEDVDYVWHGEPYQELIGETSCYDWIIASHVIEHVPDLISYLQQCEALLKPAGILSLVIPDNRYCFDYFSSSSSTGNVLDAFAEKRVRPSHGQIFDHFVNCSKRNGNIAWSSDGMGGADELMYTFADAQAEWTRSVSTTDYIDVHCWRFTPASFRLLISDLQGLGLIGLEIKSEFDTAGCEFFVSLGKKGDAPMKLDRLSILKTRKLEDV